MQQKQGNIRHGNWQSCGNSCGIIFSESRHTCLAWQFSPVCFIIVRRTKLENSPHGWCHLKFFKSRPFQTNSEVIFLPVYWSWFCLCNIFTILPSRLKNNKFARPFSGHRDDKVFPDLNKDLESYMISSDGDSKYECFSFLCAAPWLPQGSFLIILLILAMA